MAKESALGHKDTYSVRYFDLFPHDQEHGQRDSGPDAHLDEELNKKAGVQASRYARQLLSLFDIPQNHDM